MYDAVNTHRVFVQAETDNFLPTSESGNDRRADLEFTEHIPIYLQIIEYVKVLIITGAAKPGDRLPAVREMASELGINPNTVQKAYRMIEEEGIIRAERGSGNYITEDEEVILTIRKELSRNITEKYIDKMNSYGLDRAEIIRLLSETSKEKI